MNVDYGMEFTPTDDYRHRHPEAQCGCGSGEYFCVSSDIGFNNLNTVPSTVEAVKKL